MDLIYKTQLKITQQKMAGYMTLLNFRYMNLCVKAEIASLIPVNVFILGAVKNLEEVADVALPDDYHIAVVPKSDEPEALQQIAEGISMAHPEFKPTIKTTKVLNKDKQYLEYEMPEVDENRRDFLNEAVKSLHNEAKVKIEELYTSEKASYANVLSDNPTELDEVSQELDHLHDESIEGILNSKMSKLEEIEEGYQRYLSQHPDNNHNPEGTTSDFDVTQSMKMDS
jgi:ribosome recycling factor